MKVRKCENNESELRANVKVKTENDLNLHATLRNYRGGPKDPIFLEREGREKKNK